MSLSRRMGSSVPSAVGVRASETGTKSRTKPTWVSTPTVTRASTAAMSHARIASLPGRCRSRPGSSSYPASRNRKPRPTLDSRVMYCGRAKPSTWGPIRMPQKMRMTTWGTRGPGRIATIIGASAATIVTASRLSSPWAATTDSPSAQAHGVGPQHGMPDAPASGFLEQRHPPGPHVVPVLACPGRQGVIGRKQPARHLSRCRPVRGDLGKRQIQALVPRHGLLDEADLAIRAGKQSGPGPAPGDTQRDVLQAVDDLHGCRGLADGRGQRLDRDVDELADAESGILVQRPRPP